jgi:glyoxylase-like metal-dependent hydrolase (beta-lactamase superfamily II)
MIETRRLNGVTQIKMARKINGKPSYWVSAYLVDGLLIDTGCSHCADEFAGCFDRGEVNLAVNTHYHEDHVGANKQLQYKFGIGSRRLCRPIGKSPGEAPSRLK